MMTRGRGGVTIPPKNDDVIYEQPLTKNLNPFLYSVDGLVLPSPGRETLYTLVVQDREGTVQKVLIIETTSIHFLKG